jgi:hypothetical protein
MWFLTRISEFQLIRKLTWPSSSVEFQNQTKIINNVEDHPSNIFIQVGSICFSDFWEKDTNVKSYQMHEDNEKPIHLKEK